MSEQSGSKPAATPLQRRRRWPRRLGIGCLGVIVVLAIAGGVLLVTKPWAPDIVVVDPGEGGQRITEGGLLGNYYPADAKAPALLVLGGSEGGISTSADGMARTLRAEGYSTLALSYWGGPGQPPAMDSIPLETFDTALAFLSGQSAVDGSRLGVIGVSKGGEAALLVASRHPELKAIVGLVPSSVAWQGIDQQQPWRMLSIGSTWSLGGTPVRYLPYGDDFRGGDLVALYQGGLSTLAQHQDAVIPIEKATAPVLLSCGEADTLWPACQMSQQVAQRAEAKNGPKVTVLTYPNAGHFAAGPPVAKDSSLYGSLAQLGGTIEGNAAAREQSWPKILAYLERTLR